MDGKIAIEFRDKSWYRDKLYEMLEINKRGSVQHDMPSFSTPSSSFYQDFIYLRFHGECGDYRGFYSKEFLKEYAENIDEWLTDDKSSICLFQQYNGGCCTQCDCFKKLVERKQ